MYILLLNKKTYYKKMLFKHFIKPRKNKQMVRDAGTIEAIIVQHFINKK